MNGNQVMGGVGWEDFEMGAIPSSTVALSEIIYVGRASFRVALEAEAPAPAADTTAWFRSVGGDQRQTGVLSSGSGCVAAPGEPNDPSDTAREAASDTDGVPILYDSEILRPARRRARAASRWTLGLPLAFGAFFCGILMSPLVAPVRPRHKKDSHPTAAASIVATVAPVVPALTAIVAPISVAPISPPEPTVPPVTELTETFANRPTATGGKPVMPVQGRAPAAQKSGLHEAVSRRPVRIASSRSASPSGSGSHERAASAGATAAHPWVDPWAAN